jgi:hypothetical protein
MKPIGGYFELELTKENRNYHPEAPAFKSGRSALGYILSMVKPSLVYVPFYTCDGLLEPLQLLNIPYRFYEIDHLLEPVTLPGLGEKEYFVYINYFDIKGEKVNRLSEKYGDKLIVDCTQAFFMKGNGRSWYFNSCRKFFGVPDGSFLYAPGHLELPDLPVSNESYAVDHLLKRFYGYAREGYAAFQENELLCGGEIAGMSKLTEYLLDSVDYEQVIAKRRSNFEFLHSVFKSTNQLQIVPDDGVPMFYPLLVNNVPDKKQLAEKNIFIPTFWADVLKRNDAWFTTSIAITTNLLPLPIDHRYSTDEMKQLASLLKSML